MKFDCGPTWEETKARLSDWHPVYAWFPVRVGSHDCRWLEVVERKGSYYWVTAGWDWEYRARK